MYDDNDDSDEYEEEISSARAHYVDDIPVQGVSVELVNDIMQVDE